MEEKKEDKCDSCESIKNCPHCMHTMHGCCGNWKGRKCHIIRIIIMIIVLSIVFSAGATLGEHKNGFRGRGDNQRYMMGNGYGNFENGKAITGSTTVQVQPNVNISTPVPVTPKAQ
jgi:hypothetical protein